MNRWSKQACIGCHFLIKQSNPYKFEVTLLERKAIRKRDYSAFEHYSLGCHFGVWDEGHNFDKDRKHEVIVETDRKDYCFFWKHRLGMLLPAAEILQKREADNREATRDRRLTVYGLIIAAAALGVNAIIELGKMVGLIK